MNQLKIGVVGAGIMGADLAFDLSDKGHQVILKDIDEQQLTIAQERMVREFRLYKMMNPKIKSQSTSDIIDRITFTTQYEGFNDAQIIIENVTEDWEVKKRVYEELDPLVNKDAIYGVNTSCISITKVAAIVNCPERVIGMHFMNPVPLKEMVELIKGHYTSEKTISATKSFLKGLGKTSVVVEDFPGFVANRLSHLFMNEAAFLVQDQVAQPREIDLLFKKGYGHKMGPLETADLIGLDTVMDSLNVLYRAYEDSKFRCCPLLKKMVNAGLLGKKSGEGFYKY